MIAALSSATVLITVLTTGCGRGSAGSLACGQVVREAAAADSVVHVIASADPAYATDPPTSGPHSAPPAAVVFDRPLTGPEQVGILEIGAVLVQYRPGDLTAADRQVLAELTGTDLRLAPNPGLAAPVVLTAWTAKQECTRVDRSAVAGFVADHANRSQAHD